MSLPPRINRAPEIRQALTDVRRVCDALGLTAQGGKTVIRQPRGLTIRCPWHEEHTPSCSVTLREDGTIGVACFGCGVGGDVLSLIGAVRGLSLRSDFRQVLAEGARLAGLWALVDELEGRGVAPAPAPRQDPKPAPAPPRDWPPACEVLEVWGNSGLVSDDPEASTYMRGRSIDPDRLDGGELARVLPARGALPPWTRCKGGDWRSAGYRVVVPMFSPAGELRSLRAWRIVPSEGPKRLPPSGHKASELVMADYFGRALLSSGRPVETVVVVEGEPAFVSRCQVTADPRTAVLGIVSGSWSSALAARCPVGAKIVVRTDDDAAGERYAAEIIQSVKRRCFPFRVKKEAA